MSKLFSPFTLAGGIALKNRIVMAPMTRSRSPQHDSANIGNALYYTQRATAGLIVSEGTPISAAGRGYLFSPGIYTEENIAGWKLAADSVHDVGGKFFAQIWHVGRLSHVSLQENGQAPVSCTAQIAKGASAFAYNERGEQARVPVSKPRAMTAAEIGKTVQDYADAAENAIKAGFDGAEIHGANGYLIDQFMNPLVNDRTDEYSPATMEGRLRFTLEVVDAVIARIGAARTGLRLSPYVMVFDMPLYDGIDATFTALAKELAKRKLAYVHFMDHSRGKARHTETQPDPAKFSATLRHMREHLSGTPFIVAGGMTKERAEEWINEGLIDLAGFGRPFISNPDLVARLEHNWPLAEPDSATFYGGDARGYIDYPPYRPRG